MQWPHAFTDCANHFKNKLLLALCMALPMQTMIQAATPTPTVAARVAPTGAEGNYAGSFSGDDQGIFNVTIRADGVMTGLGFSLSDQANEAILGTVQANGSISFGITSSGSTFDGVIKNTGIISGTWNDPAFGESGTFKGAKTVVSPLQIAGEFQGSVKGGFSSTFTVNVDAKGVLTGTATDPTGPQTLLTGLVAGTSEFLGTDSDGAVFAGTIQPDGTLKGTVTDPSSGLTANINGKRTTSLVEKFEPTFSVSPQEGIAPLTVSFNEAGSLIPSGATITNYYWNFGDGTTAVTTVPTTTATYNSAGTFVTTLIIETDTGFFSPPAAFPVVVGKGSTDDGDLFISKAQLGVNFANHNKAIRSDFIKLTGFINPSGLPDDLSGATIRLTINGIDPAEQTSPRSRARTSSRAASKGTSFIPILKSNGAYSLSIKNVDMRNFIDVKNSTGTQNIRAKIRLEVIGTTIDTPVINGVIEAPFKVAADRSAKGAFSHINLGMRTGNFRSIKTSASEGKTGGHKIVALGPISSEFAQPIIPNGDLTISIGDDGTGSAGVSFTVPLAAFSIKGDGAKSTYTYSKKIQEVPELLKLQISNAKRKFILITSELLGTGIPLAGAAGRVTSLPIRIDVPTDTGPFVLQTSIEIKRTSTTSKKWKR